jgi:integrase
LRKWIKLAEINKKVTYHVSRHTTATLLLSWGVPVTTVQKIMGHADIRTTLRYAKVIDKNVLDAVEILDNLPSGDEPLNNPPKAVIMPDNLPNAVGKAA